MSLIEDLLDLQVPNAVRLSPSGEKVLYSTTLPLGHRKGKHVCGRLWLATTGIARSSRPLTSGLYHDTHAEWSPNGQHVAFVSDRASPGESEALYLLAVDHGGEALPVTPVENQQGIQSYAFSPDGQYIAYISSDEKTAEQKSREELGDDAMVWNEDWSYGRLRLLHIASKEVTILVHRDAHVTGTLAWSEDGSEIAFTEARTPDIENIDQFGTKICTVHLETRKITDICVFPKMLDNLMWSGAALLFMGGASTEVLVTANIVYRIELEKRTNPAYRPYARGKDECLVELSKAGKHVAVFVQNGFDDRIRLLGGPTVFSQRKKIANWDFVVHDSGDVTLAYSQEDSSSPREIFSVQIGSVPAPSVVPMPLQLSFHGAKIAQQKFGSAAFLSCKSGDGKVIIDAVYLQPSNCDVEEGQKRRPLPTFVFNHGGPYDRNTDSFNPMEMMWSAPLLTAGYGILLPNYRGGRGHGEAFAGSLHGAAGTVDYDDVITLTQHAIEEGYADKDRLIAAGWSQGGFLTYLCTVRNGLHGHGWKFRGTIPGAGIADGDLRAMTSDIGAYQDDLGAMPPWRCHKNDISTRTSSAIWEFKAAVDQTGVIPPVLILHGEKDERTPLDQAIAFRKAMQWAELPFEMVVYPREPHMFQERRHLVDLAKRVLKFVETHIGPA